MKKYPYYIAIALIVLILPIINKITIKQHEVEYKVDGYQIKEEMKKIGWEQEYRLFLKKGKQEYSYFVVQNFHKRKRIIKKIQTIKEGDITCILPTYKNEVEKELYCLKGREQVSIEILKTDPSYQKIAKKKKMSIPEESTIKKEYKKVTVYEKNIPKDSVFLVWNYKGIIVFKQNEKKYYPFLDYDLYDNIMATTTDRYFVLLENTSVNGIEKVHCYDLEKDKYKVITLENKLSKESYINGVIGNKVYITDKKKKKQYTLDMKKENLVEVGNEENLYIKYVEEEKELWKKSDFFMNNQYFKGERIENNEITESKELIKENHIFYFREENTIYKQLENKNRIKLLELEEMNRWTLNQGDILVLKEDTLYLYQDTTGLKKILEYNELKYNNENIVYFWK
ncbi:MAG: hypothetical protein J6X28_05045 [Bacilli bacterium]|nr:hypothetical protein [Bacilli bacterium]